MAVPGGFPARGLWRRPGLRWADILVGAALLALLFGLLKLAPALNAPFLPKTAPSAVSTDPADLPYYAVRSLLRMFIALILALIFTFVYATAAARLRRAEKVLIPLLDILQSVPLVWNGMLSFGGAWFFLAASESISVLNHHYALPGVGSYAAAAIAQGNLGEVGYAIVTELILVLGVNFLFWRPVTAWAERFRLAEGEIVALLGKSGSGKSTLLRCVAGLIAPSSGSVAYRGTPLTGANPGVSMVFQTFALLPWLTGREQPAEEAVAGRPADAPPSTGAGTPSCTTTTATTTSSRWSQELKPASDRRLRAAGPLLGASVALVAVISAASLRRSRPTRFRACRRRARGGCRCDRCAGRSPRLGGTGPSGA